MRHNFTLIILAAAILLGCTKQRTKEQLNIIAFYTGKNDLAHISFLKEANEWFEIQSKTYGYNYTSTSDWSQLNDSTAKIYDVMIFLDTRPDSIPHREAFERYMKNGGAWMGFHFAGFALTPSDYPQNWTWYHDEFLGSGQYKGNTWRPTKANLKVEAPMHPTMKDLPSLFESAPNEWYSWEKDLTKNNNITILAAIDSSSFPLGTGPKLYEIWREGYYPVAWTNKNYKMVYINMGHNDMDYEGGTNKPLSSSFSSEQQNKFIINTLLWLGTSNQDPGD